VAVLSGVVERAEERARIVEQVASLDSITKVENHLRPPAA
jgi:osmotically-inducible protein OsmY